MSRRRTSPVRAGLLVGLFLFAGTAAADEPVVAYYFHRTLRCETCLEMEAWAKEALETRFAAALASGRLVWRPVDFEQEENAHFEAEYALEFSSLVVVRPAASADGGDGGDGSSPRDGTAAPRWEKLEATWDLVGDRPAYFAYVREHVAAALGAGGEPADAGPAPATDAPVSSPSRMD